MSRPENQLDLSESPFDLHNLTTYQQWRNEKLPYLKPGIEDLVVSIEDPGRLTAEEKSEMLERCEKYNMAIYQLSDTSIQDKSLVRSLGLQFGLYRLDSNLRSDEDSISSLEVKQQSGNQYIPYTNKALSWHTDGYYNHLDKQIYAIVMHCVSPAAEGGVNSLLDPDSLYIALRDENPAYIEALMHPHAMTIPDNVEADMVIRAEQAGPVFTVKSDGNLHMRFSARKRNIIWHDTTATREAVAMVNSFMADEKNILKVALKPGQGIICNNVLHNRSGFTDSENQKRLMYRARYYDAVSNVSGQRP